MKRIRLLTNLATVGTWAVIAQAQPITPVWEYLLNNLPAPLPILTNALNGWTADLEFGDGLSRMDCIGPMRRYDANRLLIGIRENGIDEVGASGSYNTNLANAYPDRSLFWINPTNGQPIGFALNVGFTPCRWIPERRASGGVPGSYYWSFDVSDDGYIYSGYENHLIRYAPNGSGGFSPTPTVVFTLNRPPLRRTAFRRRNGPTSVGRISGFAVPASTPRSLPVASAPAASGFLPPPTATLSRPGRT